MICALFCGSPTPSVPAVRTNTTRSSPRPFGGFGELRVEVGGSAPPATETAHAARWAQTASHIIHMSGAWGRTMGTPPRLSAKSTAHFQESRDATIHSSSPAPSCFSETSED
ncbi:hypothetical protein SKAU_G00314470 [Synaphobranchus kaupii]|uniref:Uncharacterized protein n=1 Tax=Synaphobranchus kaupii TaxID=118154 RepID=A0A9Q1ESI4_SYNKA|nr:hypothetical protein SKAU_G00314470 [Synaphobranchus kaupii]